MILKKYWNQSVKVSKKLFWSVLVLLEIIAFSINFIIKVLFQSLFIEYYVQKESFSITLMILCFSKEDPYINSVYDEKKILGCCVEKYGANQIALVAKIHTILDLI